MKVIIGAYSNAPDRLAEVLASLTGVKPTNIAEDVKAIADSFCGGQTAEDTLTRFDNSMRDIWGDDVWVKNILRKHSSSYSTDSDGIYIMHGITHPAECSAINTAKAQGFFTELWLIDYPDVVGRTAMYSRTDKRRTTKYSVAFDRVIQAGGSPEDTAGQLLSCVLAVAPHVKEPSSKPQFEVGGMRKVNPQIGGPIVLEPHR